MEMTREQWLIEMSKRLEAGVFKPAGYEIKAKYRVSCSLPSRGAFGKKLRTLGQAWSASCSEDETCEVFISPTLADSSRVADVLAHELVHVCVGNKGGHGKVFKRCATAIGLTGKMTATVASETLKAWIAEQVAEIGTYPHARLDHKSIKKQTTRMLKVECANGEPFIARMSRKTIDDFGLPKCPCCDDRMIESTPK